MVEILGFVFSFLVEEQFLQGRDKALQGWPVGCGPFCQNLVQNFLVQKWWKHALRCWLAFGNMTIMRYNWVAIILFEARLFAI